MFTHYPIMSLECRNLVATGSDLLNHKLNGSVEILDLLIAWTSFIIVD